MTKRGPADRLAREVAILTAAAGPGVVAVHSHDVGHVADPDPAPEATMCTTFAGARTLASSPPDDVRTAALLVADLSRTVARLHQRGIVHGAISADHVVLSTTGPVLCGFGHAHRFDHREPAAEAGDIAGLASLLTDLVGTNHDLEPAPTRRLTRATWSGYEARSLLNLADRAATGRQLTAASFAADIEATMGGMPRSGPTPGPSHLCAPRFRWRAAVVLSAQVVDLIRVRRRHVLTARRLVAAGACLIVPLAVQLVAPAATRAWPTTSARDSTADASITPHPDDLAGRDRPPATGRPADATGALRTGDGWIELDGRRFAADTVAHRYVAVDWACDGGDEVAALRLETGDVWILRSGGEAEPLRDDIHLGPFGPATGLSTGDRVSAGAACPGLEVRLRDGPRLQLPLSDPAPSS